MPEINDLKTKRRIRACRDYASGNVLIFTVSLNKIFKFFLEHVLPFGISILIAPA